MKRGRLEDIQFGQPRVQPPSTGQQRIITTTQSHNATAASNTGGMIQYQIPPNVIKTANPPESVNSVSNQQQQQASQLVTPQQTSVQYTASYSSSLGGNLVKGQQTTNQAQQQQIHIVNTSNTTVRSTAHKSGAVVNAVPATVNIAATSNNGAPAAGQQQIITASMSPGVLPGGGNVSQGPPPPPPQGQAQLQRLKVEDALSYLDQVKFRFGNQPQVYNDFLDIMKEFKSQSIDTPGVIQRVSNLFRGHPELIVGFNTFLPPGYKIEVQENDQGCYLFQVSVSVQPTTSSSGASVAPQPSPHKYSTIFQGGGQIVQSTGGSLSGTGVTAGTTNVVNTSTLVSSSSGAGAINLMAYGGGSGHTNAAAPNSSSIPPLHAGGTPLQQPAGGNSSPATVQNSPSLGVATSTTCVQPVVQNFSSRNDHHRERTISTGSVVASNVSLTPSGAAASISTTTATVVSRVDVATTGSGGGGAVVTGQPSQGTQPPPSIHRMISQQIISQQQTGSGGLVPASIVTAPTQAHHQQTTVQQQVQPSQEAQTAVVTTVVPTPTAATAANQPVEFNHAITYVNKIKNRFHTQPEKYKRFLEILHTYQKEQKTYKEGALSGCMTNAKQLTEAEVYTQVAQLFDNQEDLLREFGQFLPDATSHHNQAAMQQHHVAGKNNSHNLTSSTVSATVHDHHQQQHMSGPASSAPVLSLGSGASSGGPAGTTGHGGNAKKIGNANVVVGSGTGGSLTNLKVYNSLQSGTMGRLQQDREYSIMTSEGLSGGVHGPTMGGGGGIVTGSNIAVGGGAIRTSTGCLTASGGTGAIHMEKDRNHHLVGVGGGGSGVGGNTLNAKYIHGSVTSSMSAIGSSTGTLVSGSVLSPSGPNLVSNVVMSNLTVGSNAVCAAGGGGANAIKRSPSSYAAQMGLLVGPGGVANAGNIISSSRDRGDGTGPPPMKRHKPICRDVSLAEASKYGTLNDYAFFDKVRKALRSPDVYENFLRCLTLYNQEIVSKSELQTLVTPFLSRFPDLLKWFQDFLGPAVSVGAGIGGLGLTNECIPLTAAAAAASRQDRERTQSELAADVDLSTCKRLGASYCALPKSHEGVKCSGRTNLCRDVLNDTWVSFPTWAEDSTFVTSRKTQYEEFIYRCEDERFELDVVIETNSATIRVLEGVQKKLTRMSQDEVSRFRLDDCLGGTSSTIHQRALRRIYGDKATDIIQGLKKNPSVAVPVVLRRMKTKEEEWREAQKSFNKQWREQNEKYYLKSLDHQGINFKQTDIKALRSKSLFNEIETLFDEVSYMKRHEQNDDTTATPQAASGPHMTIQYKDKTILEDAANLLIHHVKRQTGIQKQEKGRIKHILRQFVPDLFFAPRQQLSEDEREEDDKDIDVMDQDEEPSACKSTTVKKSSCTTSSNYNSTQGISLPGSCNTTSKPFGSEVSANLATSPTISVLELVTSKDNESGGGGNGIECGESSKPPPSTLSTTSSSCEKQSATATASSSSLVSTAGNNIVLPESMKNTDSNGNSNISPTEGSSVEKSIIIKTEIKEENDAASSTLLSSSAANAINEATSCQQPMSPPLPLHAISKHIEEAYTLFFTNNSWYLFLRLHAILCERLRTIYERAQIIAAEERTYENTRNNSTATALRLKPKSEIRIEEYYNIFLDMLKNLLDGNMESSSYEDTLREMFGIHAYIAFTLDRVVQNAVRQLQHCVTERGAFDCVELFQAEQRRNGAGGLCRTANRRIAAELAYQRKAEAALQDENCFKIYIYKIDCRLTIELLDTESDDTANNFANSQTYSSYVDRLSNPAATGTGSDSGGVGGGIDVGGSTSGGGIGGGNGDGENGGSVITAATSSSVGGGDSGEVAETEDGSVVESVNNCGTAVTEPGVTLTTTGCGYVANSNHGNISAGANNCNNSASSTAKSDVKVENLDDDLATQKSQPTISPTSRHRRPLFLTRNLKRRNKQTMKYASFTVTIDGHLATMKELQNTDDEEMLIHETSDEVGRSPSSETVVVTSTTSKKCPSYVTGAALDVAEPPLPSTSAEPHSTSLNIAVSLKSLCDEGMNVSNTSTKDATAILPLSSTRRRKCSDDRKSNVQNMVVVGGCESGNPFWCSDGNKKSTACDLTTERLSTTTMMMNGINNQDPHPMCIGDSEQMKENRTLLKSQMQKKKFTMYWSGSLTRSKKTHCKVTTRMGRKFKSIVECWLEQHVSASQRATCADWLLGKRHDLMKNITTIIIQNKNSNRTPYTPYNKYKVENSK
ncbi:uncharacterized protein LOC128727615 [Anopheles nili]|uniref:uncharacterized protein LOC128727615 n=1 Tax=Anopheles nili TaxID=185578 RepID=UPI00237AA39F|nr:uncharacterized protein LOC128727615 [Anopheles nili]